MKSCLHHKKNIFVLFNNIDNDSQHPMWSNYEGGKEGKEKNTAFADFYRLM